MNPEIEFLRKLVADHESIALTCRTAIDKIQAACVHRMVPDDRGGARCDECGYEPEDWYCPKNPPSYACEHEGTSHCIHCGKPEERK